jgi:glutaredoxin/glutathione-dependent peroxiredoxin
LEFLQMTLSTGDRIPAATFKTPGPDGPKDIASDEIFKGRKIVLFAVPGAFTPTCHNNHLPSFLANHDALKAKGVDAIAVTAVNDVHVMKAWAAATGAGDKIMFLADGSAHFAKAIGLELDAAAFGMGLRSKRYAMLVEDGVVKQLNIEDMPGKAEASSAEALLAKM